MKVARIVLALLVVTLFGVFSETASAYYHATMGRFLTRDPGEVKSDQQKFLARDAVPERQLPLAKLEKSLLGV